MRPPRVPGSTQQQKLPPLTPFLTSGSTSCVRPSRVPGLLLLSGTGRRTLAF